MPKPAVTKKKPTIAEAAKAETRTEPRTSAVIGWSPDRIKSAENLANAGNFSLAADLCETMMADERVSQALDKLYSATTLPLTFELPGVKSEQSKEDPIVQALETDWWRMLPEPVLREVVAWVSMLGAALLHVDDWAVDDETGRVVAKFSVWSPKHLRRDQEANAWRLRTASGPGDWAGQEETILPGDGRWILILRGSNWRSVMKAPWRGIARFWLLKQYALVDWPSNSERHGQGTAVAQNVSGTTKLPDNKRQALANDMAALKRNAVIVMPDGFEYDLVTDDANSYITFKAQIEAANSGITIGITGTNLTTEVKGGSFAAASVHAAVDAQKMRGLLELLSTGFRDQLLVWWVAFNFGTGAAPYPHWDTTPPEDLAALADTQVKASLAIGQWQKVGINPSRKWVTQKWGIVEAVDEDDELEPMQAAPVAVPVPGTTGDDNERDEEDDGDEAKSPKEKASAGGRPMAAAKASEPEPANAFERGMAYVAQLEQNCCDIAAKELAPTIAATLAAIQDADSYEDAKKRLLAAYTKVAAASRLVGATEAALIMGQLAGRETVEQELSED